MRTSRRLLAIGTASLLAAGLLSTAPAGAAPGDLDTGFGTTGVISLTAVDWEELLDVKSMASTTDGRLVLGAQVYGILGCIARLTPVGAYDATFNPGGVTPGTRCDFAPDNESVDSVAITRDGSVLAGVVSNSGQRVVRLSSAGAQLANETLPATTNFQTITGIAELGDGRVAVLTFDVVTGTRYVRVTSALGVHETTWAIPALPGFTSQFAPTIVATADGNLLIAGEATGGSTTSTVVAKVTPAGSLVTAYGGGDGVVAGATGVNGLAVADGSRLLTVARDGDTVRVTRLSATGTVDPTYGSAGSSSFVRPGTLTSAFLQRDGRLVIAGASGAALDTVWVTRLLGTGTADPGFGTAGATTWTAPIAETYRVLVAPGPLGDVYAHARRSTGTDYLVKFDGTVDSTAPAVAMTRPTLRWNLSTQVPVSWTATDPSGVASSDLRLRRATSATALPAAHVTALSGTALRSLTVTSAPGTTLCLSARARDAWSLTSAWTADRCTAVPLGPDRLSRTRNVDVVKARGSYTGRALIATARGATVAKAGVRAKRIVLVATRCPTCGRVSVYLGAKRIKTVSLTAPSLRRKQIITIASFDTVRSGKVRVVVTSQNRRVIIEGIGISAA